MFLQDDDATRLSFQQQVTEAEEDGNAVHNVSCSMCTASGFLGLRHVCRTCPDTDVCDSCMKQYVNEEGFKACRNHEFLTVSLPELHGSGTETADAIPDTIQEWLRELRTRY